MFLTKILFNLGATSLLFIILSAGAGNTAPCVGDEVETCYDEGVGQICSQVYTVSEGIGHQCKSAPFMSVDDCDQKTEKCEPPVKPPKPSVEPPKTSVVDPSMLATMPRTPLIPENDEQFTAKIKVSNLQGIIDLVKLYSKTHILRGSSGTSI